MTTLDIENYANEDGLAVGASDVNLGIRLRQKVVPKWEIDVGHAAWRRRFATINVASGDREYDLPADFSDILEIPIYDKGGLHSKLWYIGESSPYVSAAAADLTPGTPEGFYIGKSPTPPNDMRVLILNKAPDSAAIIRYGYLSRVIFTDFTTSVEMNLYMPSNLQWGLVEGLKKELYIARFGIEDRRVADAQAEYQRFVDLAIEYKEPGRRNQLKRVKMGPVA